MKTLHLTNSYHPTSGGIRHFYDVLLRSAQSLGWQLRLIVPSDVTTTRDIDSHARVYSLSAPRAALFDSRYRVLLPTNALTPWGAIARILREEQPDLIEVCDKYSLCHLAGILRKGWFAGVRRPVLVGLSCERMDDNVSSYVGLGGLGRALSSLYMRRIYLPQFDHHLAVSQYTAGELRRQAAKHPRPVHVLPLGVEVDRFSPGRRTEASRRRLLAQLGGCSTTRVLVYAGRLSLEKNPRLLLSTLDRLNQDGEDYHLVIVGDGPMSQSLKVEAMDGLARRVSFLRHLDRDSLADLLANADAFVHPNPREPFGIAPLEAMASGLPLVAPNEGGVTTYATEEGAWLAAPTASAFARRIRDVFADPQNRSRKVACALRIAWAYRWDVVARRFCATYEHLIRGTIGTPTTIS